MSPHSLFKLRNAIIVIIIDRRFFSRCLHQYYRQHCTRSHSRSLRSASLCLFDLLNHLLSSSLLTGNRERVNVDTLGWTRFHSNIFLFLSLSFSHDNLLSQSFSSIFLSDALIFCSLIMIRISVRPLSIDRTKSEARRETVFRKPCESRWF